MTIAPAQFAAVPPPPRLEPTARQMDVLVFVRDYRRLHGVMPTMQEIGDGLGVSKMTVFDMVGQLERKRIIRRDPHKSRSIEIIRPELLPRVGRLAFPVIGVISRGGIEVTTA